MGAKAEVGWTTPGEDGVKRHVFAQHVGKEWRFFQRPKRKGRDVEWEPLPEPPLIDWLELLDSVTRRADRGLHPPQANRADPRAHPRAVSRTPVHGLTSSHEGPPAHRRDAEHPARRHGNAGSCADGRKPLPTALSDAGALPLCLPLTTDPALLAEYVRRADGATRSPVATTCSAADLLARRSRGVVEDVRLR